MKKSLIIIATIFILLLLTGGFYWFEYRPAQIRKDCTQRVYDIKYFRGGLVVEPEQIRTYNQCLHEKGLAY